MPECLSCSLSKQRTLTLLPALSSLYIRRLTLLARMQVPQLFMLQASFHKYTDCIDIRLAVGRLEISLRILHWLRYVCTYALLVDFKMEQTTFSSKGSYGNITKIVPAPFVPSQFLQPENTVEGGENIVSYK